MGCSRKKQQVKKDYGKPSWLKIDKAQLTPLSEDATSLEGGKITVYDPEGWERQPRGAAKAPKGFKSVIVFKKDGATIMMTKSDKAKDLPDLDEDNIEDFAENAQQLFKSKVQMLKLGSLTGVLFAKRVADAQRLSKFYDRRIVATAIHGQLFTFELIADKGKIDKDMLNALFAVISRTEFESMESRESEEGAGDAVAATDTKIESVPAEEPATMAETKPETAPETKPEEKPTEVAETKPVEEKPAAESKVEEKPIEVVAKPTEPKPAEKTKTSTTKKKPAKKADTKAILNELDALLN